ncbi:MAG: hypothetical protein VKQ33_07665 [Candidatus Sericytochromatia bacterium]|nr:hypothetical protein [Candidatus Sericytochromatia bacterium]
MSLEPTPPSQTPPQPLQGTQPAAQARPGRQPPTSVDARQASGALRLLRGLEAYVAHPERLPAYLGGHHPDWTDRDDHCYSFLFRVAIAQGLVTDAAARRLMARIQPGDATSFRAVMFPQGFTDLPIQVRGERVTVAAGAVPAGHLVSLDGGDHVMVSTGRLLPGGRHEVLSFKGGSAGAPVWGDPVGFDPHPRLHVLALEDELEALLANDQPLDDVRAVAGRSALTP